MLNNAEEYKRMAAVENDHWWYRILHERSLIPLAPFSKREGGIKILDIGCGTGGLMMKLKEVGFTNVLGTDVSQYALKICRERRLNAMQSDVRDLPHKLQGQTFDVIICNDVLCYFTLDEIPEVISGFKTMLRPGGTLIMNNPAHKAFSGAHDRAVGIVTRFTPSYIKRVIASNGMKVESITQWPFLLSPAIYATRYIQRRENKKEVKSDIDMPSAFENNILYGICKMEMKLFKSLPYGSSVFVVAKKDS